MSDTPKFTVVDRRKFRAEDEASPAAGPESSAAARPTPAAPPSAPTPSSEPAASPISQPAAAPPRLTLVEPAHPGVAVAEELEPEIYDEGDLPPAPTAEESRFQKAAYEKAAERLDDLVRAQNPAAPAPEKIGFEHLVQQLYLSAMMQMGAGTPEGQRPRVDIVGARQTIDLLAVVHDKTRGNLSPMEVRTLDTVLYELRMTFLELTRMISAQAANPPMPPPPGGAKR